MLPAYCIVDFVALQYYVEPVEGMNEVYITGPSRNAEGMNSDNIFYTQHVDGPYGFIPFCSVFRCIVGMDKNYMVQLHSVCFPLFTF